MAVPRLAAAAPNRPLAWEILYAKGGALNNQKKKKKKRKKVFLSPVPYAYESMYIFYCFVLQILPYGVSTLFFSLMSLVCMYGFISSPSLPD